MVIILLAENVLFLKGISLPKCLDNVIQYVHIGKILVCIRTELLDGILHLNDHGAISLFGKQYRVKVLSLLVLYIL